MQAGSRGGCPRGGVGSGRRAWRRRHAGVLVAACLLLGREFLLPTCAERGAPRVREALLRCEEALFVAGSGPLGSLPSLRRAPAAAAAAISGSSAAAEAAVADAEEAASKSDDDGADKSVLSQVGVKTLSGPVGGEFGGGLVWINRPGERSFEVRWAPNDTVADLKQVIREQSSLPYDNQELRCNGKPVEPDSLLLDDWVQQAGGVTAGFAGQAPDIWVFDATDEDERDAAYPPIVKEDELTQGEKTFKQVVFVLTGFAVIFTLTQAIGINPLVETSGKIYDTSGMQFIMPDE